MMVNAQTSELAAKVLPIFLGSRGDGTILAPEMDKLLVTGD
jgi:hypothetical protein